MIPMNELPVKRSRVPALRLLPLLLFLALAACRAEWTTTTFADLGLRLDRPTAWAMEDTGNGLLLGSTADVVTALEADAVIEGGAAAITVEEVAALQGASAVDLVALVLDNFGDLAGGRWRLAGAPEDVEINGVPGAQAILKNETEGEAGQVTVRVLTGETMAVFFILIDTTPDGAHQDSLLRIANSTALLR